MPDLDSRALSRKRPFRSALAEYRDQTRQGLARVALVTSWTCLNRSGLGLQACMSHSVVHREWWACTHERRRSGSENF